MNILGLNVFLNIFTFTKFTFFINLLTYIISQVVKANAQNTTNPTIIQKTADAL